MIERRNAYDEQIASANRQRQEALREEREKENRRLERIKKKMEQDHFDGNLIFLSIVLLLTLMSDCIQVTQRHDYYDHQLSSSGIHLHGNDLKDDQKFKNIFSNQTQERTADGEQEELHRRPPGQTGETETGEAEREGDRQQNYSHSFRRVKQGEAKEDYGNGKIVFENLVTHQSKTKRLIANVIWSLSYI